MANKYEALPPLHEGLPPRGPAGVPVAQPVATVMGEPVGNGAAYGYGDVEADAWTAGLAGTGAAVRRDWRGGLCQCVGHGTSHEWQLCALACCCSGIAFGQNMRRGLGLDFGRQALLCFAAVTLTHWFVNLLSYSKCGGAPAMPVGEMSVTSSEFQWAGWEASANSYSACTQPYAAAQTFFWMLTWLFFLYAGWRRIQMRRRFGLPGDDVRDYITWLACPVCALCQETRTLAVNRCDGGVWHGPRATQTGAPGMQAFPGGALPQLPQAPPSYGQAPQAWAPQVPLAQQQGAQLPLPQAPPSYGQAQADAQAQEAAAAAPLSAGVPQGMYVPPRGEHAA